VYTALFSLFSPNIVIGTVVRTEPVRKNAMQLIYLRSSTNFRNLQYVYVIENKMSEEKKVLEDSTTKK
jgi:rod shape-determining protein MreC